MNSTRNTIGLFLALVLFLAPKGVGQCPGFGCTDTCMVNINCDIDIDGVVIDSTSPVRKDLRRAVVKLFHPTLLSGCTGTLINSYSVDCTDTVPRYFIITQSHCLYSIVDDGELDSLEFWFNYEMDSCADTTEIEPTPIIKKGAYLRWWKRLGPTGTCDTSPGTTTERDIALLEMKEAPPDSAFYAGWEKLPVLPSASVGIHHAFGDVKQINVSTDSVVTCSPNAIAIGPPLEGWEIGYIQGGASGSSLFSLDSYKLIGVGPSGPVASSCAEVEGQAQATDYQVLDGIWDRRSDPDWDMSPNSGYTCCVGTTGNVDNDPGQNVDIADLTMLASFLFTSPFPPVECPSEANVDADSLCNVDIADLTLLIDKLFINFPPLPNCSAFDESECLPPLNLTLGDWLAPGFPQVNSIEGWEPDSTYTPCGP